MNENLFWSVTILEPISDVELLHVDTSVNQQVSLQLFKL